LKAVSDFEFRTAFVTIYGAGLRVSEAVALTIKDIDSARMVIHIRSGKGRKDRYVMLSEQLLGILRAYWRCARPQHFLFPGPDPARPITVRSLQRACRLAAETAGLDKMVTVHTLRHSSPRTCWSKGWTSASFRTCWDTGMSTPPLGMPGSQSIRSDRSKLLLTP
jgi:integrase/recombinase XerD